MDPLPTRMLPWLALFFAAPLHAQDFPEGSTVPVAADIRRLVEGKVLDAMLKSGTRWRLEYKPDGYFFLNTSTGFNSSGTWTAEDGRLCGRLQGRDHSCNDVRVFKGLLHYRHVDGEIVAYVPR